MRLLSRRLGVVLVAGLLVTGFLAGFADEDAAAAKEPRATIGKVMVAPAAFIPEVDETDYDNGGAWLTSPSGRFVAPLWFPHTEVRVRRVTVLAYDNSAGNKVCVSVMRASPLQGAVTGLATACTTNRTDNPQQASASALPTLPVNTTRHGPYLSLRIDPLTLFYGVQVVYSY